MLSRLSFGFLALMLTAAIVACSNLGMTTGVDVGPTFPGKTLYASNSNENAISIYTNGTKSATGPTYNIGGSSTTLNGPQYLAFDRRGQLWVTNYNPATNRSLLVEFAAQATGDVLPLVSSALSGRPRGIAFTPKQQSAGPFASGTPSPVPDLMVISDVDPTLSIASRVLLFNAGTVVPYQELGGPKPNLKVPGGVAIDPQGYLYVTNIQGRSVEQFALPTPSPTPKPTPTPTATPKPTPTPTGSPSPTPSPSPSPTPINVFPRFTLGPKNGVITPYGVALDSSGNIYIADQGKRNAACSSVNAPAILVFPPYNKKVPYGKPSRKIQGCNTLLIAPTDVKVDGSGLTYVADSTSSGGGIVYIFAAGAQGNVAPTYYKSPGTVTGLGIVP